jgi:serine protease Do
MTVRSLTQKEARRLGLPRAVMVTAVEPQSPADLAGIVRGTLIIEANGKPVGSPAEFEAVLAQRGDGVILRILEGKRSRYLSLRRR